MRILPTYIRDDFSRNRVAWWIIAISLLILVFFTFKRTRLTTNPRSRIITVERLLEAGTFVHSGPEGQTPFELSIDHVQIDGRIYSSKPPNYPLLMAAELWPLHALTGWNFYDHKVDYIRIVTLLNQVLPFALMLITALLLLQNYTRDRWTLNFMMLTMGVGSLAFGYAVTINNHTVAAVLFFVAFAVLMQLEKGEKSIKWSLIAGLMAGFAATVELQGAVFTFLLFLLTIIHKNSSPVAFLAGAVVPVLVSMAVFYQITGSIKPFYLQGDLYKYSGSYWQSPEGLDVLRESKWQYGFHLLFGHHGLFSMTPVLLLGVVGIIRLVRKNHALKWIALGLSGGILVVFIFILTRTHNYGGYSIGLRWFIHFMPLLMFMAFPVVERLGRSVSGKIIAFLLLLGGLPWVWECLWQEAFVRSSLDLLWLGELPA